MKFEKVENVVIDRLAAVGCWLAPIPSAALVTRAVVAHLKWEIGLGMVSGAVVELLGLTATSTALTLWDWNEGRRKTDRPAPFPLAVTLVVFYFICTVGLTVLLDIAPSLARYAPAIFPALALVGTVNLALRRQHARRLADIEAEKAERKAERKAATEERKAATETRKKAAQISGNAPEARVAEYTAVSFKTRERARALLAERPDITGAELGRLLGRSDRLGRKLRSELLPEIFSNDGGGKG